MRRAAEGYNMSGIGLVTIDRGRKRRELHRSVAHQVSFGALACIAAGQRPGRTVPGRDGGRLAGTVTLVVSSSQPDARGAGSHGAGTRSLTSRLQNADRLRRAVADLAGPGLRGRTGWQVVGAGCGQVRGQPPRASNRSPHNSALPQGVMGSVRLPPVEGCPRDRCR